jgi:BirA family biotin operon repressor/biotin-[acetyl-CoA-carboxylase] ligase
MKLIWPAEAIWEAVYPLLPNFTVEVLPEIDSSNAELMRRARAGQTEPVLLVAEAQTAGRGRLGRPWNSGAQPGDVLTFSLGLPLEMADWSGLSLAVGLAAAKALHPEIQLKWPNDLWWRERKLAGILIETTQVQGLRYAVIGMGLNIAPREAAGMNTPPAWLQELDKALDAPKALALIARPLIQTILQFQSTGFAPLQKAFGKRDVLAGRDVKLSDGTEGKALGVDERGVLLVHTPDGLKKIDSAEVSVRPVSAP